MYEDKTLVCKDCGNEFVFTAGEQEFYASRGFENEPQPCKACSFSVGQSGSAQPFLKSALPKAPGVFKKHLVQNRLRQPARQKVPV